METSTNKESRAAFKQNSEDAKKFLAEGFLPLLKKVFFQPLELNQEFKQGNTQPQTAVLVLLAGIITTLLPYLSIGKSGRLFIQFKFFLRAGIAVMLTLIIIGILCWGIKKLFQKSTEFQKELFTGALCAFPLTVVVILICLLNLIFSGYNFLGGITYILNGPISSIICVYGFFLMITICFQSLRSVYIKANTAWYLSPAIVMVAIYLSYKIVDWF